MSVDPTVRILLEEIASERSRKRRLESLLDDVLAEKEDLMLACGLAPRAPSPSTNTIQQQQQMTTSSALAAFPGTASAATATATATTTAAASPGGSITAEYEYKIVTKRQRLSFNPNNARSPFTGATPRRRANLLALSAPAMEQEGRAGTEPQPIVTFPPEASAAEPLASARATQTLPQPLSTSSPMMHSGASEQSANSPILTRITNNERVCDVTTQQQQQQQQQQDGETTDANKEAEQTATDGAIVPTKPPLLHFPSLTLPPPRPGSFSIGLGSLGSIGSLGSFGSFSQLFDVQRRNSSSSDAALVAAAAEAVASGSMSGRKASIGRGIVANSRFSMDWSQWTDDHALCDTLTDFFDF